MQRLIPITALRHLYQHVRDVPNTEYQHALAKELVRIPDYLQELTQTSEAHFSVYDNRKEGFRPAPGTLTQKRRESTKPADRLAVAFFDGNVIFPEGIDVQYAFVDYDVSPFRTTSSEFENCDLSTSSGLGGADLLLTDLNSSFPAVGEIKADTDRNPLHAFLQSLTYAVELSTPAQRARLSQCYPGRFQWPTQGPWIDICLLMIRLPDDGRHADLLGLTHELVNKTVVRGTSIGNLVRRVVCLNTDLDQLDPVEFRVVFNHDIGRW